MDIDVPCFQAEINLGGYGAQQAIMMTFFFDPNIKFGLYAQNSGLYLSFYHPEDYLTPLDGFYVGPSDYLVVSATTEHKIQHKLFAEETCIDREGLVWYNFTGKPFQARYHPFFCANLCFAETFYKEGCDCSPIRGLNITKLIAFLGGKTELASFKKWQ